jgi:hypothetical protein
LKITLALLAIFSISIASISGVSQDAFAVLIDNDGTLGVLGYFDADVIGGGEVASSTITASRLASADLFDEQTIFDYFTYIDIGSSVFQLGTTGGAAALTGDDEVTSSGSFTGSNGNNIDWTAVSTIMSGGSILSTKYTFTATDGNLELGNIRLIQYLDEDIEAVSDCVLKITGSAATNDLQLFTIDNVEVYGVSHSGALSNAQGLASSTFAGYAADDFNDMKPAITGQTLTFSPLGNIIGLTPFVHPQLGNAFGPDDIVSSMAWDVDSQATTSMIITTLGGVPDATNLPEPEICGDGIDNDQDGMIDENCDLIVAGEIIPIEATSLILTGALSPAVWMVSSFSILGIGAFLIARNPANVRNIKVILQDYLDRL